VCGFAHAPNLLFCCSFLKCGVIIISSFHIIAFRKLLVSVDDIIQNEYQMLESVTEFRTDTNGDQMTFTFI